MGDELCHLDEIAGRLCFILYWNECAEAFTMDLDSPILSAGSSKKSRKKGLFSL